MGVWRRLRIFHPFGAVKMVRLSFRTTGESSVARIAGVNIPTNKRVTIGLRYIYGIGPAKAAAISRAWESRAGISGSRSSSKCKADAAEGHGDVAGAVATALHAFGQDEVVETCPGEPG